MLNTWKKDDYHWAGVESSMVITLKSHT